jgi:hypothetical protein
MHKLPPHSDTLLNLATLTMVQSTENDLFASLLDFTRQKDLIKNSIDLE